MILPLEKFTAPMFRYMFLSFCHTRLILFEPPLPKSILILSKLSVPVGRLSIKVTVCILKMFVDHLNLIIYKSVVLFVLITLQDIYTNTLIELGASCAIATSSNKTVLVAGKVPGAKPVLPTFMLLYYSNATWGQEMWKQLPAKGY